MLLSSIVNKDKYNNLFKKNQNKKSSHISGSLCYRWIFNGIRLCSSGCRAFYEKKI